MSELSGKIVLLTGASRGIGAAAFKSAIDAGAKVILHYGKSHDAVARLTEGVDPERCLALSADLAEPDEVTRLWDEALAWKGDINVLVNNAAIYEHADLNWPLEQWHASWSRTLQVNLQAPADLCRSAIQHYRARGGGIIINIASRGAFRGERATYAHYSASKGALVSLTRSLARSFAKEGVLSYCVSPGWTATDMAFQGASPEVLEAGKLENPFGEITPPEDVAEVITFLSSGRSPHANGITFDVTGGSYMR